MYLFAHVFSGALIGLGCMYLIHDLRALPVCILGSILPDLLDKPLAFLFPGILGTSRTIGHSLLFFVFAVVAGVLLWHYHRTLLGLVFACGVLSHQVLDAMWNLPGSWFFPLLGSFPVIIITDYVRHSLWLELASPSELVFAIASGILIIAWFPEIVNNRFSPLMACTNFRVRAGMAAILALMGTYLLYAGLIQMPTTFFAPAYAPITNLMVGVLALCGAVVLVRIPQFPGFGKTGTP
jgi:hypothetical protein